MLSLLDNGSLWQPHKMFNQTGCFSDKTTSNDKKRQIGYQMGSFSDQMLHLLTKQVCLVTEQAFDDQSGTLAEQTLTNLACSVTMLYVC